MVDKQKYITILTSNGKDQKTAEQYVSKVLDAVKKSMPNESDDVIDATILLKINTDLHGVAGSQPFNGICIGLDRIEDQHKFDKDKALAAYKENATLTVSNGLVAVENGVPIPLDSRKFLDKAETKENKNFGKPLPTKLRRQGIFLIEDTIYRAFGLFDAEIGKVHTFKGSLNNGFLNIVDNSVKVSPEQPAGGVLWNVIYNAAGNSSFVTALSDIKDAAKNATIITKGVIRHIQSTSNGGAMVVIYDEDTPDGIVCFTSCDNVTAQTDILTAGLTIITSGRVSKYQDKTNIVSYGFIVDPSSSKVASTLDGLSDISLD